MSRLVKKALRPFSSKEKIEKTEKTETAEKRFVPPPALKELVPQLTGDPVTLAIIGGGQRGKASRSLARSYDRK